MNDLSNTVYRAALNCLIMITSLDEMYFDTDNHQVWQKIKSFSLIAWID